MIDRIMSDKNCFIIIKEQIQKIAQKYDLKV